MRQFIDDTYMPWFKTHHKGHEKTLHTLDNNFEAIMAQRIDAITGRDLDQIRARIERTGEELQALQANAEAATRSATVTGNDLLKSPKA